MWDRPSQAGYASKPSSRKPTITFTAGSITAPEAVQRIPATSKPEIDTALADLAGARNKWTATTVDERIALLDEVIAATAAEAEPWTRDACEAKGIPFDGPVAGEEWAAGPLLTIRSARVLRNALADIRDHGSPRPPGKARALPNGQIAVSVFPVDIYDRLLLSGSTGAVWMEPGISVGELTQAKAYREPSPATVGLVLGAGNVASIPVLDVLTKMFVESQVVALKMNPVNDYLGPHISRAFKALIDGDYLRVIYGGAAEGQHLTQHQLVEQIHITGSDKTYEAIVFGPGEEGSRRKMAGEPVIAKPITAELGNVTPVIVVPGPWTESDLAYQGENIAAMLTNNAGFNCIAARVLVTDPAWSQREALLESVGEALEQTDQRHAYYPGAEDRWRQFVDEHPEAKTFGQSKEGAVPWTLVEGLSPKAEGEACFTTEVFAGLFAESPVGSSASVPEWLERSVEFCNEKLWGTLGATIIVHPSSLKDQGTAQAVERAVAELNYGTVGVNMWVGLGYAMATLAWGGFPGHDASDIQSGSGFVHNPFMFDQPHKSVVRGPWRVRPKPLWFASNRQAHKLGRKLVALEAKPSLTKIPSIVASALRG